MTESIEWPPRPSPWVRRGLSAARGLLIGAALGGALWLLLLVAALALRVVLDS